MSRISLQHAALLAGLCLPVFTFAADNNRNAFNPAISLALNGTLAHFDQDHHHDELPGFPVGEAHGHAEPGFSLGESELTLAANVDSYFFGSLTLALAEHEGETEVELEEGYLQTLALPAGFTLKAGRFLSRIGYLNEQHRHTDLFVDRPLVYRALLGEHYGDDGVQLRWLAPTTQFLELGAESFNGKRFPAGGSANEGLGSSTVFVHTGNDLGDETSYRVGLSWLRAKAALRETGDTPDEFTGTSGLWVVDAVLKWAPDGNVHQRHLQLQGEWLHQREDGDFNGLPVRGNREGWYLQAGWQFTPRWRTGLRYDRLTADNRGAGVIGTVLEEDGHQPERIAALLEFSPSEFSRLRLQYNRDESGHETDHRLLLNYSLSLGAHAAHAY